MTEMINKRLEELEKDYQNIVSAINRIDQDRSNLVTRGVSIRGAIDELQRLRSEVESQETPEQVENQDIPEQHIVDNPNDVDNK